MRTARALILGAALLAAFPKPSSAAGPELPRPLFQDNGQNEKTGGKSPGLAFLMSLLVPGLGELYAGSTRWGIGFLAVEAATWANYARWRSKGNDIKADFRSFADRNWDEIRYREWQTYNRANGSPYHENETLPCKDTDPNAANCQKVDTQQYYEMIGKYDQFVFGWDDTRDIAFEEQFNPEVQSEYRRQYEDQRNESNKYLKRASFIAGFSVFTRIASAIHASVYARNQNRPEQEKRIWFSLSPTDDDGRPAPAATLNARF